MGINVSKEILRSAFINGLKIDVQAEVRMARLEGLIDVMDFAEKVEERNMVLAEVRAKNGIWAKRIGPNKPIEFESWKWAKGNGPNKPIEPENSKVLG